MKKKQVIRCLLLAIFLLTSLVLEKKGSDFLLSFQNIRGLLTKEDNLVGVASIIEGEIPIWNNEENEIPVSGIIDLNALTNEGTFVKLRQDNEAVRALKEGLVIEIGEDFVVISQTDGHNLQYGSLEGVNVRLYQYVLPNTIIGTTSSINNYEVILTSLNKDNHVLYRDLR